MGAPELWIVAGPNGAGKTTLTHWPPVAKLLGSLLILNPDDLTLKLLRDRGLSAFADASPELLASTFLEAARFVEAAVWRRLRQRQSVLVESVLSTSKYQAPVEFVREQKGIFGLIYVALKSPELSRARVQQRVLTGGHDVPSEKLSARWRRSLELLPWFVERADCFYAYDNSESLPSAAPRLVAQSVLGDLKVLAPDAIPELTAALKTVRRRP
jgi:predicted ABC-type ATPase